MPETPDKAYNPPRWRVWFPQLAMLAGGSAGVPVIFAFGPSAFAIYLVSLLLIVTGVDWLFDRRWPIPPDDDLEELLAAEHDESRILPDP
jgi:hypothetical protein